MQKLIHDTFCRNSDSAALIAFKSIKSQLHRERIKNRSKLPKSITTLADQLKYYTSINIYKGCVTASDGKKALFFSNDILLQALESSTEIFCDSTFNVSLITYVYIIFILLY